MKNGCPKYGSGTILGSILGGVFDQRTRPKMVEKLSVSGMQFGRHFWLSWGCILDAILALLGPGRPEKGRTGNTAKISTASRREAHL